MAKDILTDEQVELEIEQLRDNEYVRLAEKEVRLKYKRRKYLYQLRFYEKRGKVLAAQGYTLENMEDQINAMNIDELEG